MRAIVAGLGAQDGRRLLPTGPTTTEGCGVAGESPEVDGLTLEPDTNRPLRVENPHSHDDVELAVALRVEVQEVARSIGAEDERETPRSGPNRRQPCILCLVE